MPSSAPPPRPKQSPASAASASKPPAVLRDKKKKQQPQEPRYLDLNPESNRDSASSSTSSSSLVSPYHVTEVTGGHLRSPEVASPERVWMESLRQGGVPVPVPGELRLPTASPAQSAAPPGPSMQGWLSGS